MTLESPLMALRRAQLSTLGATGPLAEALATTRLAKVREKMEIRTKKNGGDFSKGKVKGGTRKVGRWWRFIYYIPCTFLFLLFLNMLPPLFFGPSPLFTILASSVCCQVGFFLFFLLGSSSTLVVFFPFFSAVVWLLLCHYFSCCYVVVLFVSCLPL